MTCISVHHQVMPTADGRVSVMRLGCVLEDAETISTTISRFCVTLTPNEARRMALAMRAPYGHFFKEDAVDSVEVWCEEYEAYEITWRHKDGEQVCEPMNCCKGAYGDGWSWDFAQALDEAADKAEGGQ